MTVADTPLLEVRDLVKHFPLRRRGLRAPTGVVRALDGVSFSIRPGSTLGIVGESGSGKSTAARAVLRLIEPSSGSIRFEGREITGLRGAQLRALRREMQMVFQDPYASLDPRMTVRSIVAEPLVVHGTYSSSGGRRHVEELLERVGLDPADAGRHPHEFSGGQRQRIGVARALALRPKLIVCDEPVSALDVSVQAQMINLLQDLQQEFGLAYLFIAHDLSVVKQISDEVAVMYLGRIVESGPAAGIFERAMHPYTQALLSAVPVPDPGAATPGRIVLRGDPPNPIDPPTGCALHPRCHLAAALGAWGEVATEKIGRAGRAVPVRCVRERPALASDEGEADHPAACHFARLGPLR